MAECPESERFASRVEAELDHGGAVSRTVPDFAPRAGQQELGGAVASTLARGGILVAEAGTGIGKTCAYLVPALLDGRRVIVSTGTRTLQDQLFHRDLPRLRGALQAETASPMRVALLKGRANYLCRFRLEQAVEEGRFSDPSDAARIRRAAEWAESTDSGDLAEAPAGTEAVAERITATPEQCLGHRCPAYDQCFFYEARRQAHEADVLVVNHHLLLADWAVKGSGYGAVLPEADALILDEAHLLPDTAARFFGQSVSARAVRDLLRDTRAADRRECGDTPELPARIDAVEDAVGHLRDAFGPGDRRGAWQELVGAGAASVADQAAELRRALGRLEQMLEALAGRGAELEACHRRSAELGADLERFLDPGDSGEVQWYETRGKGLSLHLTPLDVGSAFRQRLEREATAWVFVSATLAVGESFAAFRGRLGLPAEGVRTLQLASPFDYPNRSLLYCPRGMPQPNMRGYDQAVIAEAKPLIEATPGGVFLLFTSHRALRLAREQLEDELDRPLLVQGDAPQAQLLERFAQEGNAVLLGTSSFWQGVDIRGAALSAVVIDRLPFGAPNDPVTAARHQAVEERGGVAFRDISLPEAVIALKQGAGRLIRDDGDRGVLMIADPRLLGKPYGRLFLDSLPAMPRVQSLEAVTRFWEVEAWT